MWKNSTITGNSIKFEPTFKSKNLKVKPENPNSGEVNTFHFIIKAPSVNHNDGALSTVPACTFVLTYKLNDNIYKICTKRYMYIYILHYKQLKKHQGYKKLIQKKYAMMSETCS